MMLAYSSLRKSIAKSRRRKQTLRRFAGDKRGSTAVEFAILSIPFFGIFYSTAEVGWYYFANFAVDSAVTDIGRELRTGTIRIDDDTEVDDFFRQQVCPRLAVFGACDNVLTFEVETFTSFTALANSDPDVTCRNDSSESISEIKFDPVGENDIVRINICMLYTTLNPAVGVNLADEEGKRRLTNSFVFRSEPFERNQRGSQNGNG